MECKNYSDPQRHLVSNIKIILDTWWCLERQKPRQAKQKEAVNAAVCTLTQGATMGLIDGASKKLMFFLFVCL